MDDNPRDPDRGRKDKERDDEKEKETEDRREYRPLGRPVREQDLGSRKHPPRFALNTPDERKDLPEQLFAAADEAARAFGGLAKSAVVDIAPFVLHSGADLARRLTRHLRRRHRIGSAEHNQLAGQLRSDLPPHTATLMRQQPHQFSVLEGGAIHGNVGNTYVEHDGRIEYADLMASQPADATPERHDLLRIRAEHDVVTSVDFHDLARGQRLFYVDTPERVLNYFGNQATLNRYLVNTDNHDNTTICLTVTPAIAKTVQEHVQLVINPVEMMTIEIARGLLGLALGLGFGATCDAVHQTLTALPDVADAVGGLAELTAESIRPEGRAGQGSVDPAEWFRSNLTFEIDLRAGRADGQQLFARSRTWDGVNSLKNVNIAVHVTGADGQLGVADYFCFGLPFQAIVDELPRLMAQVSQAVFEDAKAQVAESANADSGRKDKDKS